MVVRKNPVCPNCQFGYSIQLVKDIKKQAWICPLCKYKLLFKEWSDKI